MAKKVKKSAKKTVRKPAKKVASKKGKKKSAPKAKKKKSVKKTVKKKNVKKAKKVVKKSAKKTVKKKSAPKAKKKAVAKKTVSKPAAKKTSAKKVVRKPAVKKPITSTPIFKTETPRFEAPVFSNPFSQTVTEQSSFVSTPVNETPDTNSSNNESVSEETSSSNEEEEERREPFKQHITRLKAGDRAPYFTGLNQHGNSVSINNYTGKTIVLYFYPKDDTPGCTAESCSLRDEYDYLSNNGFVVIGVSADGIKSHEKFAAKYELPFDLLADENLHIIKAYDVWGQKMLAGRIYDGIVRTTFIIDPDGIIKEVITKVDTENHAQQVLQLYSV